MLAFNIKRRIFTLSANFVRQLGKQPTAEPMIEDSDHPLELPPYTEEQSKLILNAINEQSAEQLVRFVLSKFIKYFSYCLSF